MPQIKHYVIAIRNAYKLDSFYKNISDETIDRYPNYRIAENGLFYIVSAGEARLCIPAKCDNVIRAILHDFHESDIAGHPGIRRCYQAIGYVREFPRCSAFEGRLDLPRLDAEFRNRHFRAFAALAARKMKEKMKELVYLNDNISIVV